MKNDYIQEDFHIDLYIYKDKWHTEFVSELNLFSRLAQSCAVIIVDVWGTDQTKGKRHF